MMNFELLYQKAMNHIVVLMDQIHGLQARIDVLEQQLIEERKQKNEKDSAPVTPKKR